VVLSSVSDVFPMRIDVLVVVVCSAVITYPCPWTTSSSASCLQLLQVPVYNQLQPLSSSIFRLCSRRTILSVVCGC
jgi:hypothetical protein